MTTRPYKKIYEDSVQALLAFAKDAVRLREEDISDFNNLKNIFVSGRKVSKIPTGSSDISGSRVDDRSYDADYLYICVDNSGTPAWRRAKLESF
jgi:hypothetical protein